MKKCTHKYRELQGSKLIRNNLLRGENEMTPRARAAHVCCGLLLWALITHDLLRIVGKHGAVEAGYRSSHLFYRTWEEKLWCSEVKIYLILLPLSCEYEDEKFPQHRRDSLNLFDVGRDCREWGGKWVGSGKWEFSGADFIWCYHVCYAGVSRNPYAQEAKQRRLLLNDSAGTDTWPRPPPAAPGTTPL